MSEFLFFEYVIYHSKQTDSEKNITHTLICFTFFNITGAKDNIHLAKRHVIYNINSI